MTARPLRLATSAERFPTAGTFSIARGSRTEAVVVVAALSTGSRIGRGECVPYARYDETVPSVIAEIEAMAEPLSRGLDHEGLRERMRPGAARNALDCALWDLEAQTTGKPVHELLGLAAPTPVVTAFTISLGAPAEMAQAARSNADRPLLKVKLGGAGDAERIRAVRHAAPRARLIVDANEAWTPTTYLEFGSACAEAGVELIEQPLPSADDACLRDLPRPVPLCADESVHDTESVGRLVGLYDAVNIKLDKTGGLTEALRLRSRALEANLRIMVGCMLGTSLGMAPAILLTDRAEWVDLDGPLLLREDRPGGLVYANGMVEPRRPTLWGGC